MTERLAKIVLGIVQNDRKKVLIVERAREESGEGNVRLSWAFPGGKIENNESREFAVEREVLEETGYQVISIKLISEKQHSQFPVYTYYLACELLETKQVFKPKNEEIKQFKWVDPTELQEYFTTELDQQVAAYLRF